MKMNYLHVSKLTMLGAVAVFMTSCNGLSSMLKNAKQVTFTATPNPLEMKGDSVLVTITGQFPAKYFNKKATMEVIPTLTYEGGVKAFKTQKLQGEGVEANATIINSTTGGSFTYTDKIAYTDELAKSDLVIKVKATVKTKSIDLPDYKVGSGVLATAKLVHADAKTISAVDQFKRRTPEEREAAIKYLISQAKVRTEETKKKEIKSIDAYLDSVKNDKNKEIASVDISAYASPDGPLAFNTKLSEDRGTSASQFYKESVKKNPAAASAKINTKSTSEDWEGFKKLMQNSSIEDKEMILRVLDMNSDPDVRNKEIKNMSKAFKKIAKDILPELRRSKFTINVDKLGKSDSVLLALGQNDTAHLSIEEFMRGAATTKDNAIQEKIYNNAIKQYPQEWRPLNNLGCALINDGKIDEALTTLQKADDLAKGEKMVKNNIGAAYQIKGDFTKASQYFDLAAGAGKEVNYNQGALLIKKGKYQEAIDAFGSVASFNAALAKLLNGDTNGALNTITQTENPSDALGYYLKAIIGARTSNTDLLFTNLRTAVTKDAKLAAKAKKDMEFVKFFDDATFKSIVQ